jgi:hypothetical protein
VLAQITTAPEDFIGSFIVAGGTSMKYHAGFLSVYEGFSAGILQEE